MGATASEYLRKRVDRAKARWLKRVMYDPFLNPTTKWFAYCVADHLNCVTLDSWPSLPRVRGLMGCASVKTPRRAARNLERAGFITLRSSERQLYRFAPVFTPDDEQDTKGHGKGHSKPHGADTDVPESLLLIRTTPPPRRGGRGRDEVLAEPKYDSAKRGAIEVQLMMLLGGRGHLLLPRLAALDDLIIERLCRAHSEGAIGQAELTAARIAAEQV